MVLMIQTTGLEEYAPGGTARIKVLTIGGPGAGKTRWSSYFPKPIFADCERGLASVADRNVPFVNINSSQDMIDLLTYLKQEARQPNEQRKYQTVVIDTLDAFQRKVKNEWMEKEKKSVFTGWEAWGYLNSRMQLLMTRLLNLDLNVVVNVHYKDRTTKDDETGKETHELMLQLQGELSDTAFNDFDLVGWMGTYWEAVEGERVQKRGLTFRPTPDKPFLKDRLHVTPNWLEVAFADSDYTALFERIQAKLSDISASEVIGEVPTETVAAPSGFVIPPGAIGSGALPPGAAQREISVGYAQMDKPTLGKLCRDRGISTSVTGAPIKANTLKSELVDALEAYDSAHPAAAETPPAPNGKAAPAAPAPAAPAAAAPAAAPAVTRTVEPALRKVPEGLVDVGTGELVTPAAPARPSAPTPEQAVAAVVETLGATLVEDKPVPVPAAAPAPSQAASSAPAQDPIQTCAECGKDLAGENPDFVKLSWIKYRQRYCEEHYLARKSAR